MRVQKISAQQLEELVKTEESHFFDFKQSAIQPNKLQRTVVAFSNADGGEVIVGIKDKKVSSSATDRWDGLPNIEDFNGVLQALFNTNPPLDIRYRFLQHETSGDYALVINIEKGSQVSLASDGKVYQRQGAQNLPLSVHQIQSLTFAKGAASYEDQPLQELEPESLVDSEHLIRFLTDLSPQSDPLEFLSNQNLITHKEWNPRVCGTLLFHNAPSAVIPTRCAVKITRYETREDDPERDHLAYQDTIEAPLYDLISATVNKVTETMSQVEVWTSSGRKKLEYPPEAIWEIVVNAIIHRDYSISDDTQILIYNDRIEVRSPGRLPGYVSVENILDARFSRNPKIVRTLNRYKNAPNKDLGEGINTTFQKMKEFGLKDPIIVEDGNYVSVTLPHIPLATPTEAILEFLSNNSEITNKQARELTGIKSENAMKKEFYKLRDSGEIAMVPGKAGRNAAWQLTKQS
ncbi:RNA-binding domain-containing protein [Thalassospira sp.]|uniref:RNA-binding domain-containing protein n=1 Tax=Thalassospira sp. TaxID=1912094 RepID=UPI000C5B94C0|nr:RNA-binding domain-containing protein [Thalassospira sp.]MAL38261.1 transcriptional regulator [Thalassospira sp.]HAY50272.1 transcriptional regulator [Thalassospira sp.]|tara:strand:+ start:587 stop:1972 length:1386 start_codon:yes stop_codon:yes gene_type:complete